MSRKAKYQPAGAGRKISISMASHERQLWYMMILGGAYIALQILADITVAKMVVVVGFSIPAGSLIYALTFTLRDLVHKSLGTKIVRQLIVLAGVINALMAVWLIVVSRMTAPEWWVHQAAYDTILGIMPRVVTVSILSEILSELLDTEVYQRWITHVTPKYQWLRVLVSNAVAGVVDAAFFGFGAFYGTMPLYALLEIIKGGAVWKVLLAVPSMWAIYMVEGE